jgi:hypothetical protein
LKSWNHGIHEPHENLRGDAGDFWVRVVCKAVKVFYSCANILRAVVSLAPRGTSGVRIPRKEKSRMETLDPRSDRPSQRAALKTHAVQTLRDDWNATAPREAFGLRVIDHRFGNRGSWEGSLLVAVPPGYAFRG